MPEPDSTGDGTQAAPPGVPRAAVTTDTVPTRIGKFAVKAVLGEGAFGRVYLGFDAELERQVAIKVPKPEGLTPDMRERFVREARATAKIHHPNVCPVYEVGADGDLPYIVMHYLAGTTLAAHLDKWKVLPPLHAVALAQKLALGMAAAHAQGVIHRDLKPQNVLFDPTRQLVLVTDFGLARIGDHPHATVAGAVFGTPLYMSPEQARGEVDKVGPLSDVYSLGVILYRMLTGAVPFEGGVYEVLRHHCETAPVPPTVARRGLDPRLDRLCLKALEKAPADRYPSAKAFADALGEHMRGGDSTAWQAPDEARARKSADPVPAAPPAVPPIPPAPLKFTPTAGTARKSAPQLPATPAAPRPAPVAPRLPDDFGTVPEESGGGRQKVLIGGVLLLFALTLVGLGIVFTRDRTPPVTEKAYVPPAPEQNPAPAPVVPDPPKPAPKKEEPPKKPVDPPSIANGFAGHRFDQAAERRTAEWVLAVGGDLKIAPTPGETKVVTRKEELPPAFTVARFEIRSKPDLTEADMKANLAGLSGPVEVYFRDCRQLGDDTVQVIARIPKLKSLQVIRAGQVTDKALATLAGHPAITGLFVENTSISKNGIKHLTTLPALHRLTLAVPDTDEWLPVLAPVEGLTHLNLDAEGPRWLSAAGLVHLKPFPKLRHLTLFGRLPTDEWLEQLVAVAPFDELEDLDLRETSIEGPGLVHLKKLQRLEWIDLGFGRITDAGAAHLAALPKLRYLFLDGTTVGDTGLQALTKSKTLEVLALKENKKVTDKGLAHLAACPKLVELDLSSTEIGDAGLEELARSKSLKKLHLTGTRVTAAGVAALQAALPGCDIVRAEKK